MYSGTVIAVIGTSSAAMTSRNIALDPKNENRAKPYPAKAASTVAPPPPASAYSAVFANHWVNVLEQQREVVEELKRPCEPEAERLEDVGLSLRRVDDDPCDRYQGEHGEQGAQHRQQGHGAAAQPVQPDRDHLRPLAQALRPATAAAGGAARRRRRGGGGIRAARGRGGHGVPSLRRRNTSETAEMATMTNPRTTAAAAARLVCAPAIAVL